MMAQFELKQKLDFFTKGLELRAMFNTQRYSYFENKRQYTPYYYMIDVYDKENDIYTLKSLNEGSMALGYDPSYKTVSSSIYMEAEANYNRTFDETFHLRIRQPLFYGIQLRSERLRTFCKKRTLGVLPLNRIGLDDLERSFLAGKYAAYHA